MKKLWMLLKGLLGLALALLGADFAIGPLKRVFSDTVEPKQLIQLGVGIGLFLLAWMVVASLRSREKWVQIFHPVNGWPAETFLSRVTDLAEDFAKKCQKNSIAPIPSCVDVLPAIEEHVRSSSMETPDRLGACALFGEILRVELDGKWTMVRRSGVRVPAIEVRKGFSRHMILPMLWIAAASEHSEHDDFTLSDFLEHAREEIG